MLQFAPYQDTDINALNVGVGSRVPDWAGGVARRTVGAAKGAFGPAHLHVAAKGPARVHWARVRTPAPPPQVEEAITEALENDNLQLQGLAGQKYVQLNPMFGDSVASWQKRLGTVDAVLTTWTDVQKKWQALESIFVGSADIRVQLPEDSKRFAAVNADFQVCWVPDGWCGLCSVERM